MAMAKETHSKKKRENETTTDDEGKSKERSSSRETCKCKERTPRGAEEVLLCWWLWLKFDIG